MLPALLALPYLVAFDIDPEGRLLIGYDGSGVRDLHEVGPDGEWRRLTASGERVVNAAYVPGTRQVVVEHDTGGDERGQLSLLDLAGSAEPQPLVHDPAYFHHLIAARSGRVLFTTNRRNEVDFDLVARDLATGAETTLYDGGGYVYAVNPSPDDRWVTVSRAGGPANSIHVLLVETATGAISDVTAYDDPTSVYAVSWLPDSSGFLLSGDMDRERVAVARYDVATRSFTPVVTDDERDLIGWASPDGRHLVVAASLDGEVSLALHSADGSLVAPIALPAGGCGAVLSDAAPCWSADGEQLVITYTNPVEPPYVFRYSVADGVLDEVRAPEPVELPAGLVPPAAYRVESFDGEQVPVYVFQPEGGGDGSAVLFVHGGPEWQHGKIWHPLVAGLVAEGHTVLVPNVRGSTGYGKRWYSLDDRELRLDSVRDLAALHAWLPTIGVDQSRVALWGGSYGGYMVLAGLAFQPSLWAAGVNLVGVASLVTFLENTSPYRRRVREREYGYLETDREFLESVSPLSRVDAIVAPLFVIHGANDPRVPLSEAEQIAAALEERKVPYELHVYGDEGHGLVKRANKLDAYPKAFAFLREHLSRQ